GNRPTSMFHVEHSPDGSTCRPREGFEGAERNVPRGTFHPQVVLDVGPSRHPRCSTWNIHAWLCPWAVPRGTSSAGLTPMFHVEHHRTKRDRSESSVQSNRPDVPRGTLQECAPRRASVGR